MSGRDSIAQLSKTLDFHRKLCLAARANGWVSHAYAVPHNRGVGELKGKRLEQDRQDDLWKVC